MKYLSLLVKRYKKYQHEKAIFKNAPIKFFNFWDIENFNEFWFQRFITERNLNPKQKTINFFSVFGPRFKLKREKADMNIFFSGENLIRFKKYKDYCINDVDLALGFDELLNDKYLRFPLWIMDFFEPNATLDSINKKSQSINFYQNNPILKREKFCSLIARHDENGLRLKMKTTLDAIAKIDCAGKLFNNTNELKTVFNDSKTAFLKQYQFNICPENTNTLGYVTEKLFESITAGCIPIYWGGRNTPEPEVLNSKAILFFDETGDNQQLMKTVSEIHQYPDLYRDFVSQNPLMPNASEYIFEKLILLEDKFKTILKNL